MNANVTTEERPILMRQNGKRRDRDVLYVLHYIV